MSARDTAKGAIIGVAAVAGSALPYAGAAVMGSSLSGPAKEQALSLFANTTEGLQGTAQGIRDAEEAAATEQVAEAEYANHAAVDPGDAADDTEADDASEDASYDAEDGDAEGYGDGDAEGYGDGDAGGGL
jgi:hypothetical protein